jgi:hypothetical protein
MSWRRSKLAACLGSGFALAGCALLASLDEHTSTSDSLDANTTADTSTSDASPPGDATSIDGSTADAGPDQDARVGDGGWQLLLSDDFTPLDGGGFTPPWGGTQKFGDASVNHGVARFKSPPAALFMRTVTAGDTSAAQAFLFKPLIGSHAAIRVRFHLNLSDIGVPEPANAASTATSDLVVLRSSNYEIFVQLRGKPGQNALLVFERKLPVTTPGQNDFATFTSPLLADQWRWVVLEVTLGPTPHVTLNFDRDAGADRIVDTNLLESPEAGVLVDPTLLVGSEASPLSSTWGVYIDDISVESRP